MKVCQVAVKRVAEVLRPNIFFSGLFVNEHSLAISDGRGNSNKM